MPATSQYEPGDLVVLSWTVAVDGTPTSATVAVTVTAPDGTTSTPSVTESPTGTFTASFTAAQWGEHTYRWVASGAVTAADSGTFTVGGIPLQDVKDALDITGTTDDTELQRLIDAALAEYATYVRPLPGQHTERISANGSQVILATGDVTAITEAAYTDGTTIDVADLDLDSPTGVVGWGYGTTGWFTTGSRNLVITYTVGPIPAHHREAIIADVAGLFQSTQRTTIVDDQGYTQQLENGTGRPAVLYPRIRALAPPRIA